MYLVGAPTQRMVQRWPAQPAALKVVLAMTRPLTPGDDLLFDGIDASLTLARGAIAETGSLILWPDPSEPRLMSLVPAAALCAAG
jgi:L-lactate dehydrogenase complex protein LldG